MKKLAIIFGLALSLSFITACHGIHFGKGVAGSGVRKTEKRIVSDFKKIEIGGAYEVEVVAGQQQQNLELEGDDNILPLINTEVKNGTLYINSNRPFNVKNAIHIKIAAADVQGMDISGACNVSAKNIKTDRFEINASGASDVKVQGETTSLKIESNGASDIDAEKMTARSVNVSVSGAGTTRVNATEELTADASGASKIIYSGEPKVVNKKDSGASSITKK
jgi:hypothetical protein